MSTKRSTNSTALYFIALIVIIVAFLLLGGGPWLRGIFHNGRSMHTADWNWTQILISFGLGFLLGLVVSRRR